MNKESIQMDLAIDGVRENSKDVTPSLYRIRIFTERAKDLCNTTIGFPIFTEVPCDRLMGKDAANQIKEAAHNKKFTFTIGDVDKNKI